MKERYWTNLVTSLRHAQCVLLLGPEAPAKPASAIDPLSAAQDVNYTEELTRRLASELEDDNRRVTGGTLAVVAQQYEDTEGFGPNKPWGSLSTGGYCVLTSEPTILTMR
jgi:hypothetical protein